MLINSYPETLKTCDKSSLMREQALSWASAWGNSVLLTGQFSLSMFGPWELGQNSWALRQILALGQVVWEVSLISASASTELVSADL